MPFDPSDATEAAEDAALAAVVLTALGHPGAERLGSGVEAQVFALGPETVVKVYRAADTEWQKRCETFVSRLAAAQPPFALPVTLETAEVDGARYAIQRRVPGRQLADVLPTLRGADRERALLSYLETAEAIGTVELAAVEPAESGPDRPFCHVLQCGPASSKAWTRFLRTWALDHLRRDEAGVREDVPALDAAVAHYETSLSLVADVTHPRLVHGDYWLENVLIGDDHRVSGVVDWGGNVLAGDPRIDLAQAIFYLDMLDGHDAGDADLLLGDAARRHGPGICEIVNLYRLHYALMYAADCKHFDPLTYRWCVRHLRAVAE